MVQKYLIPLTAAAWSMAIMVMVVNGLPALTAR